MPQMKTEKEVREEARRIRERAKGLSGFWIAELASAAAALDWTLGKSPRAPSEDIGSRDSAEGKVAASLLKAAQNAAAASKKPGPKAVPRPAPAGRPAKKKS
jgi:hypothetical protein